MPLTFYAKNSAFCLHFMKEALPNLGIDSQQHCLLFKYHLLLLFKVPTLGN